MVILSLLLLISLSVSQDEAIWDSSMDTVAPQPTDCTDGEVQEYCGVTFRCQCVWSMPTMLGSSHSCGTLVLDRSSTEVHPAWFLGKKSSISLMSNSVDNELLDGGAFNNFLNPEDPDTEGCGVESEEGFLSLRVGQIEGVEGTQFMPGNIVPILKFISKQTGGKCLYKNRTPLEKGEQCQRSSLKLFSQMSEDDFVEQMDFVYGIRVYLPGASVADAERAITAVQDGYKARFNMNRSPCARTEKADEIICKI